MHTTLLLLAGTSRFYRSFFISISLCVLIHSGVIRAGLQTEFRAGAVNGNITLAEQTYKSTELFAHGYFLGSIPLSPRLSLIAHERFDGLLHFGEERSLDFVTQSSHLRPYAEKNIPSSNDILGGIQFGSRGTLILSQRVQNTFGADNLFVNPNPNILPYYSDVFDPAGWGVVDQNPHTASYTRLYGMLPIQNFTVSADIQAAAHFIEMRSWGFNGTTNSFDSLAGSRQGSDVNLWTDVNGTYSWNTFFHTGANAFIKSNFSGRATYNYSRYSLFAQGTLIAGAQNMLTWAAQGNWTESRIMSDKTYSTGLGGEFYLRDVWMFAYGWYLKGTATLRLGNGGLVKQRYEASLRKSGPTESAIEAGYFTTLGGLFPTQGPYLRSNLRLGNRVDISANGKLIFEGPDTYAPQTQWMKWQVSPEIALALTDRQALFAGGEYVTYNGEVFNGFPGKLVLALGFRSVIQ